MLVELATDGRVSKGTYVFGLQVVSRTDLFPCRRTATEVPEGLSHFKRLYDNPLLLLVVSDLSVSSHGEVLSQWVPIKAVVGHDSPEVRVANKENTKQVVHLSLVPIGSVIEIAETGNRCRLIRIRLDPQARVVTDTEHVVDDLEALVLGGIVDGRDVRDLGILGGGVVLEEGKGWDDARGRNVNGQLVLPDRESVLIRIGRSYKTGIAHCWTYLGRHDIRYCPYLCSASPFSLYLSAGLTMGALSFSMGSRGAYYKSS
jgi:hypothetical protein